MKSEAATIGTAFREERESGAGSADYTDRRQVEDELRKSQALLAAELRDTKLLQEVSLAMTAELDVQQLYERIVDAAITITGSDFASMQRYCPEVGQGELNLLAHRNLGEKGARYWEWVTKATASTCGESLRLGGVRVIIPDFDESEALCGTEELEAFQSSGVRSAQSTPLKSRDGQLLGMLSTHWKHPYIPSERELRLLDILVRQAADLIEKHMIDERLERLVKERTANLLQANEQLQGFTYSVAHDIRQRIRGINANASILLMEAGASLREEDRETLSRLVSNAKSLSTLVDDMLSYARFGKNNPGKAVVDITMLANDLREELLNANPENSLRISVEEGLVAIGDSTMIRIVLQNLMENAAKYSSRCATPKIEVGFLNGAFYVRDNGIGFDMVYAERIFLPFERLHRDSDYEGNGIGLANVKRIVERHGGSVFVDSSQGAGATFYFALPRPDQGVSPDLTSQQFRLPACFENRVLA